MDIKKKLKSFNNGVKDNSSGIKAAANDLGKSIDAAATDTAAAIDVVSGNVSQAKNAANDLISMINDSIDNNDSASAKKLIDKLKDYVKKFVPKFFKSSFGKKVDGLSDKLVLVRLFILIRSSTVVLYFLAILYNVSPALTV